MLRALPIPILLLGMSLPSLAVAQPKRVVIQEFTGRAAGSVRAQVVRGLRDTGDVTLVPRSDVAQTVRRLGLRLESPRSYTDVAQLLEVDAFVEGRIVRRSGRFVAEVSVRDGFSGEVANEHQWRARRPRSLGRVIRRTVWRRLGDTILGTAAPDGGNVEPAVEMEEPLDLESLEREAPPEVVENPTDDLVVPEADLDPELYPEDRPGAPFVAAHSPLEIEVGVSLRNRGFAYAGDAGMNPPYDYPVGPAAGLAAEWYPGAHVDNGVLAHVGATFDFSHSFLMATAGPNGVAYPTADSRWSVGARARANLGDTRLSFDLGLGRHAFSIEAEHVRDGEPPIASVGYTHARLGAAAQIPVAGVTLHLRAGWLPVLDVGEIGEEAYFPGATAGGGEVSVGIGYPLSDVFEFRGSLDGRLYVLEFGAPAPDPLTGVASGPTGATDRFISLNAGIAWRAGPTGF